MGAAILVDVRDKAMKVRMIHCDLIWEIPVHNIVAKHPIRQRE